MVYINRICWFCMGGLLTISAYGLWIHDINNTFSFGLTTAIAALAGALITEDLC